MRRTAIIAAVVTLSTVAGVLMIGGFSLPACVVVLTYAGLPMILST